VLGGTVSKFRQNLALQVVICVISAALCVGTIWWIAKFHGVHASADCNLARIVVLAVTAPENQIATCTSVPFAADLPSLALAATSVFAVASVILLSWRVRHLLTDLAATGLISRRQFDRGPLAEAIARFRHRVFGHKVIRTAVFVIVLFAGALLYLWVKDHGPMLNDIVQLQAGATAASGIDGPGPTWWAHYDRPVLMVLWIVIGCVGTYAALELGWLYVSVFPVLRMLPRSVSFRALAAWQDRHHGWRPVTQILAITYLGFVNFMVSYLAIVYLLRGPELGSARNLIIGVIAILGVAANTSFLVMVVWTVYRCHSRAVDRELTLIRMQLRDFDRYGPSLEGKEKAALLLRAGQLAEIRKFPASGLLGKAFTLLPGVAAAVKLLQEAIRLLGV
jgi:hypothetical protein